MQVQCSWAFFLNEGAIWLRFGAIWCNVVQFGANKPRRFDGGLNAGFSAFQSAGGLAEAASTYSS